MKKRNACLAGLAAAATLLAGCVAQYRNPGSCEQEMRNRLAGTPHGKLSVTHTAVAYRGARVVVEGQLAPPASAVAAASAAAASAAKARGASAAAATASASAVTAASAASAVAVASASNASAASAASASVAASTPAASSVAATSPASATVAASAAAASGAKTAKSNAKTPLGKFFAHFSHAKKTQTPAAAECTFDESGLKTFRWLAPADLAKTTPEPHAN